MATNNKNLSALINPLSKDNPVIVQILGICSCLAVTAKLEPAFVMGISVIAVLAFSNVIISLLRKTIPTNIRIIVQLVVVAALVIVVNQLLLAREEGVTLRADFHANVLLRGTCLNYITAGAFDRSLLIIGMDTFLHCSCSPLSSSIGQMRLSPQNHWLV